MFHIDKEFVNPNISVTVRFTEVLYKWLKEVSQRENISFNQLVLQCCKNARDEDLKGEKETPKGEQVDRV